MRTNQLVALTSGIALAASMMISASAQPVDSHLTLTASTSSSFRDKVDHDKKDKKDHDKNDDHGKDGKDHK